MATTSATNSLTSLARGIAENDLTRYETTNPLRKIVLETQEASRLIEENARENRRDRFTASDRTSPAATPVTAPAAQRQGQARTQAVYTDPNTQERLSTRVNPRTSVVSTTATVSSGILASSGLAAGYAKPDTTAVSRPTLLTNALNEPRTATLRTNPLASEKRVSTASVESTTKPNDIRDRAIAAYRTSQDRRTERTERSA